MGFSSIKTPGSIHLISIVAWSICFGFISGLQMNCGVFQGLHNLPVLHGAEWGKDQNYPA